MSGDRLYSVETGTSAQTVAKMLRVLYPDAASVLDATWGTGRFWKGTPLIGLRVIGLDLSPHGRPDVLGDFTRLPFADGAFDVAIFDPPYLSDTSRKSTSIMDRRFGSYRSEREARSTVQAGAAEAWRVARLGILVKVQDHCHASRKVWMSQWLRDVIPMEPYDMVHQVAQSKVIDPKWTGSQLSVWSNSTSFWAWRKDGPVHRRRQEALCASR